MERNLGNSTPRGEAVHRNVREVAESSLKFIWQLLVAATRHDIFSLAANIAFYAFFSLFPLLVLVIYAASTLVPNTPTEQLLVDFIRPYFPALPVAKEFITTNIARLTEVGQKVGLVSAVILTWSATSGFIAVQQALDVITECPQQRSFVSRRLIAFGMLFVLLLFTISSSIVIAIYPAIGTSIFAKFAFLPWVQAVHGVSRVLFPLSLFLGCIIFYRYLPSQSMKWRSIIPGALIATAALDVGRSMFVWYASHLVTYEVVYGTLAAVMLLVLWMYIASAVMLFGAEVASVLTVTLYPHDKTA